MSFRIIKDKDNGFQAFFKGLGKFDKKRAKVGIFGPEATSSRDGGGPTNVELGLIHEFGAPAANVPQRSFLRSSADDNERKYQRRLEKISKKFVKNPKGVNPEAELLVLAEIARSDVVKKIKAHIPPPLKAATVARKGGETLPLVDTGQLLGSITAGVGRDD